MGIKIGKIRWKWIIVLLSAVFVVGCGGKEQEAEPTPTSGVERPAFAADDDVDEDVWTWPKSGLKEDLPKRDTAGQEDYNGMNRMILNDTDKNHRSLFCADAGEDVYGHWMWVDEKGIYFCCRTKEPIEINGVIKTAMKLNNYCLPFGLKEPVENPLEMAERAGWGNYYLAFYAPIRLISRTEEKGDIQGTFVR